MFAARSGRLGMLLWKRACPALAAAAPRAGIVSLAPLAGPRASPATASSRGACSSGCSSGSGSALSGGRPHLRPHFRRGWASQPAAAAAEVAATKEQQQQQGAEEEELIELPTSDESEALLRIRHSVSFAAPPRPPGCYCVCCVRWLL